MHITIHIRIFSKNLICCYLWLHRINKESKKERQRSISIFVVKLTAVINEFKYLDTKSTSKPSGRMSKTLSTYLCHMKGCSKSRCKNLFSNYPIKILLRTGDNGSPIIKHDVVNKIRH